jgi:hypothetical protein
MRNPARMSAWSSAISTPSVMAPPGAARGAEPGDGPDRLAGVIEQLQYEDSRFHVEGDSWAADRSWVRGYDQVLIPMERASSDLHPLRPSPASGSAATSSTVRPETTDSGWLLTGLRLASACSSSILTSSQRSRLPFPMRVRA